MIKIRLFWRIFFAFWLAGLLLVLGTTLLVLHAGETERAKQRHQEMIEDISRFIIQQHESGVDSTRAIKRMLRNNHNAQSPRSHFDARAPRHPYALQIFDGDTLVFQNRRKINKARLVNSATIESESGKAYTVLASDRHTPHVVLDTLRTLTRVQLFLIFIFAGCVSFILSLSISRPLKKLSAFSQQVTQGDLTIAPDEKLLRRSDEVGDLANDISSMLNTIHAQFAAQQQLLHDVSHELRAPLARLQAITALLEQQPDKASVHGEQLHREFEHIDLLIRKILDYSRMEQAHNHTERLDLVALVQEQIEKLKLESPSRAVVFTQTNAPIFIQGYPELAACAIENILRNADKYSPASQAIDITITSGGDTVQLTIRDHGNGVKEAEIEKLFTPFYRANNLMHSDGFGLGLSIAKRAMEKHRGKLSLSNHPQGGLAVCLQFPLAG